MSVIEMLKGLRAKTPLGKLTESEGLTVMLELMEMQGTISAPGTYEKARAAIKHLAAVEAA